MDDLWWRIIEIASLFSTRIRFPAQNAKVKKRKANEEEKPDEEDLTLVVEPHVIPNRGPYPYNQPKRYVELMLTVKPFRQSNCTWFSLAAKDALNIRINIACYGNTDIHLCPF